MSRVFQPAANAFSMTFTPTASDIDANEHVNNVVYVRWLQDVGTAHWNARFDDATRAPDESSSSDVISSSPMR